MGVGNFNLTKITILTPSFIWKSNFLFLLSLTIVVTAAAAATAAAAVPVAWEYLVTEGKGLKMMKSSALFG